MEYRKLPHVDEDEDFDKLALSRCDKLSVKADACPECGHCDARCPFSVKRQARMKEIAEYFGE